MKMPRLLFQVAAFFFLLMNSADAQQSATPGYIKADRLFTQGQFGVPATDFIFSDNLTQERRSFIARSLQRIPAQACPDNPPFTLTHVVPLLRNTAGLSWTERFEVDCDPKVRRTWLIIARANSTISTQEIVPGDTITDITIQADAAREVTAKASGKKPAGCEDIPKLMDTRVLGIASEAPAEWNELWIYRVCDTTVEVDVWFRGAQKGDAVWIAKAR